MEVCLHAQPQLDLNGVLDGFSLGMAHVFQEIFDFDFTRPQQKATHFPDFSYLRFASTTADFRLLSESYFGSRPIAPARGERRSGELALLSDCLVGCENRGAYSLWWCHVDISGNFRDNVIFTKKIVKDRKEFIETEGETEMRSVKVHKIKNMYASFIEKKERKTLGN